MRTSGRSIRASRMLCEECRELRELEKVGGKKRESTPILLTCGHFRTPKLLVGRDGAESIESLVEDILKLRERTREGSQKLILRFPSSPFPMTSVVEEEAA